LQPPGRVVDDELETADVAAIDDADPRRRFGLAVADVGLTGRASPWHRTASLGQERIRHKRRSGRSRAVLPARRILSARREALLTIL
jgi:hypothetical protein